MDETTTDLTPADALRHGLAQLNALNADDRLLTREAEPWLIAVEVSCRHLRREIAQEAAQ